MESAMNDRFCSCGCGLLVSYEVHETEWAVHFFDERNYAHAIERCPHCGATLDINAIG